MSWLNTSLWLKYKLYFYIIDVYLPTFCLNLAKTIIGFSNSIGGKLVIGIEDGTQKVRGIDKDYLPLLVDKINNIIADSITPKIIPNMYKEIIEDKIVLIVEIYFGESTPYHLKTGRPEDSTYIRYYGSTRLADELAYKELYLRGQKSYFDSQPYQIAKPLTTDELNTFCKRMTEFDRIIFNNNNNGHQTLNLELTTTTTGFTANGSSYIYVG